MEGNTYTRLGDMINSSPIYVGKSVGSYPNTDPFPSASGSTYQDFQNGVATSRIPMVYVGANDGMLHAFRADTDASYGGNEIFAYIPSVLSPATASTTSGLHKLTEADSHHAYVDLTPSVADAYTTTPKDATRSWRTILVGGLRSGGKGIYAIDITNPASNMTSEATASNKVMWEFTSADDADLGYTYSEPVIVPLRVATNSTTPTDDIQWFAVFGNGYNSTNGGHAVLFLLKLSGPTGASGAWQLGTDYFKIDTGVGDSTTPNGLSSPAVIDNDGDGIYDRVYAGDLRGNMWAFDLNSITALSKTSTGGWASAYDTSGTPKPLFTASSATSTLQPITSKPLVIRNKAAATGGMPNVLVMFGTGSYIANGDESNTDSQTYYAVWDHGDQELTRSKLVAKNLASSSTSTYFAIDPATSDVPNYSTATPDEGWYLDLPDKGERVTSRSYIIGSYLFFSSIVPSPSPCSGGGYTKLFALDPTTGKSPSIPVFDINHDGVIDATDTPSTVAAQNTQIAGVKIDSLIPQFSFLVNTTPPGPKPPCSSGSSVIGMGTTSEAGLVSQSLCTGSSAAKAGRYSWRQLDFN